MFRAYLLVVFCFFTAVAQNPPADIDAWVVARAIRTLAELGATRPDLRLSVNLSSFAFEDDGLATRVRTLLKEHGVDGNHLVVVESAAHRSACSKSCMPVGAQ